MGWEVIFWNNTSFDLTDLGFSEIKLQGQPKPKSDLLKRAKIEVELNHFTGKFQDPVYQTYKFPSPSNSVKSFVKNKIVAVHANKYSGEKKLNILRQKLKKSEKRSSYYNACRIVLEKERPDFIFCTNQRPLTAIAPLSAAQDLGIPTGTFIFSWDNLPKATMVVDTDHFFVWSEYMNEELLKYYPHINPRQIHITGSPQFEPHYDKTLRKSREDFFGENNLDLTKRYLCFSGDDITTCPDDTSYLKDVAEAVEKINLQGDQKLGIIFRRSPVDFSDRYEMVLEEYKNLIVPLAPAWKKTGDNWNAVLPTKKDLELQINTILHSEAVINLASSMVFDFAIFNKPCLYLNYNVENKTDEKWFPQKVYDFIHFRSMPTGDEVIWLQSKEEIEQKIKLALSGSMENVHLANTWFSKINQQPAEKASERIWKSIDKIHQECI